MEFVTPAGEQEYAGVVRAAEDLLVCLDFDGVLAPIVEDPSEAHVHPDAQQTLVDLAEVCRSIAVVTGRPARQAIELGRLDEVGAAMEERGRTLHLRGQYGNERWDSSVRRVSSPRPPEGLATFEAELPAVLREHDAADAFLEDKGLAIGVHTRRLSDPDAALDRLRGPVAVLARKHGLVVEPGRQVLEVRAPGADKGAAVRDLLEQTGASAVLFAGDDLGDVAAFSAITDLRAESSARGSSLPSLLVASASETAAVPELTSRADVVVDGPDGVIALLRSLTADASAARL
ncbi:trehalose-phosphatase [uncultured Nocardioides sp.]|uniref:trehalose-phosphatase n=1 Tax=uncultured Nocardioides sp. TaxID=198441 RepID=UPI002609BAD5|nr:trehalose-phosphatase [uncultured Nocardioides sp.]